MVLSDRLKSAFFVPFGIWMERIAPRKARVYSRTFNHSILQKKISWVLSSCVEFLTLHWLSHPAILRYFPIQGILAFIVCHMQSCAMQSWKEHSKWSREKKLIALQAMSHRTKTSLFKAFDTWHHKAFRKAHLRSLGQSLLAKLKNIHLLKLFNTWKDRVRFKNVMRYYLLVQSLVSRSKKGNPGDGTSIRGSLKFSNRIAKYWN